MLLKFLLDDRGFVIQNPEEAKFTTSIDYIKCHFDVRSSMWSGMEACCAVFKNLTFNKYDSVMLDSNNNCYINPDLYTRGGTLTVKLVGDKYHSDGVRYTTHQTGLVTFKIIEGVVIPIRVPDKYDVFVAEYEIAKQNYQDIREDLVFIADCNVTTYEEVTAAVQAGKVVIARASVGNGFYRYYYLHDHYYDAVDDSFFTFSSTSPTFLSSATLTENNVWNLFSSRIAKLESPVFTGTPTAPTAAPGTDTTQLATTAFVQAAIAAAIRNLQS